MKKKFADLKVYTNKRNGQKTVVLPKKLIKGNLKKVRILWRQ